MNRAVRCHIPLASLAILLALPPAAEAWSFAVGFQVVVAPVRFIGNRLADLADAVECNVGVGRGFKVDLSYGVHFFGLGEVRAWRYGNMDRRVGYWREIDYELSLFPVSLLGWPVSGAAGLAGSKRLAEDARFVATAGTHGVEHLDRLEFLGDVEFKVIRDTADGWSHTRWGDSFPIGVEAHLGLVGVRLRLRPLQLADFVLGFVGLDLDPWLHRTPAER